MQRSRPTLIDVARAAGVSRSTASRAINGQPSVAADVRQRVLQAVAMLGYRPDSAARALASGRIDVIDLVVVEPYVGAFGTNPFYGRVTAGLLAALDGTDVKTRIHVSPARSTVRLLDELAGSGSLGALLVNVPGVLAAKFRRRHGQVMSLGRFSSEVPYSDADNAYGAALAVEHLVSGGRHVIGAIGGPHWNPCSGQRRAGYLDAMAAAGLRPLWTDGNFRREGGYDGTMRLLEQHPGLDAIVAACDMTAAGALQALAATGRRVPDDVAVVGFDDSVLASLTTPPLTSVRQPVEEMTAAAARELLRGRVDDGWHQTFPVSLSVRASTG